MLEALRKNMILFRLNRTWVEDGKTSSALTYFLRLVNVANQIFAAFAITAETYFQRHNIAVLSFGLCTLFAHEPCVSKYISVIKNRKLIQNIMKKLETDLSVKFKIDKRERKHIEQAEKFISKYVVSYILLTFVGCSSWTTFPLLKKLLIYLKLVRDPNILMNFPIPAWTPLDVTNVYEYALAYFLDVYFLYSIWAIWVGTDALFAGMMLHLSAHFRILSERIQGLKKGTLIDMSKDLTLRKGKIDFKSFLSHHLELLSICKDVNRVFSDGLFHQLINVTIVICFCGMHIIVTSSTEISQVLSMILVLISMVASWFVCCFLGTTIIIESQKLAESVYFSDWIHFSPQERKIARFILQRCQDPVCMTAGKYFRISLGTFLDMMKMSYSLLAVLREVYD